MNEWKIPSVADSQLPYDRKDDDGFWKHIKTCFERVPTKRPSMDELGTNLEWVSRLNLLLLRHVLMEAG